MSRSSAASFALGAGWAAALSASALAVAFRNVSHDEFRWAAIGFLATALPLIASGSWLARSHGRTGVTFVVALGAGLLLRAALVAFVVAGALRAGSGALAGALGGLAAGFVPLTAFEMFWFARRARSLEPRGSA